MALPPSRSNGGRLLLGLLGLAVLAAFLGRRAGPGEATLAPEAWLLPVNAASRDAWMLLPGLGPARAGRILAERERGGPFQDGPDLVRRLPELGPAVHRAILPLLEFRTGLGGGL